MVIQIYQQGNRDTTQCQNINIKGLTYIQKLAHRARDYKTTKVLQL